MKLGKFFKILLIVFDIVLLALIVDSFLRNYVPLNQPVYWIGVIVEIGIGWLAYWFWMRSLLVKGLKFDRIMVIVLLLLGLGLPNAYYISGLDFLNPAGPSDLFFYFTVIALIIYSSYTIDKYLAAHKKHTLKSGAR